MAKILKVEQQIAGLKQMRAEGKTPSGISKLRDVFGAAKFGLVIAMATRVAETWDAKELAADMARALARLCVEGAKRDPGCEGKLAVIKVLQEWEWDAPEVYLQGIHYFQPEPTLGGPVDTARELRGLCALALVINRYEGVMPLLVELLVDKEKESRAMAAQALGFTRREEAAWLLRLKAMIGDSNAEVMGECMVGILRIEGEAGLAFVRRFAEGKDKFLAEAAVLAAGDSKLKGAMALLQRAWMTWRSSAIGPTVLMAVGMLRSEEAVAFLMDIMREGMERESMDALDAMRVYMHDEKMVARVRQATDGKSKKVRMAVEEIFKSTVGRE